jgi:hypothetical protein
MFHTRGTGFEQTLQAGVERVNSDYFAGESKELNTKTVIKEETGRFDPDAEKPKSVIPAPVPEAVVTPDPAPTPAPAAVAADPAPTPTPTPKPVAKAAVVKKATEPKK